MIETSIGLPGSIPNLGSDTPLRIAGTSPEAVEIAQRFEQMLWAEMLSHAGLEKAVSQGGGEAASAFSRYVVEAIAEDMAAAHPLGLTREGAANLRPASVSYAEPER